MAATKRKSVKYAKNKKDKDVFIECVITKGRKTQTIRSSNPDYVVRQLRKDY